MPDDGQSTPPLVPLPVADYVLPALANTVTSVLELPSLHPLSQFLGTANTHDFATSEVDTIALLLAISRQNEHLHGLLDTLRQKVHTIGLQNDTLTQQLAAPSTQVQGVAPATTEAHLAAITSRIQLQGDNFKSFAAENNAALSHIRSSVSALEQRVGMAQTPNPVNPAQPQNAKSAQPPARRQATNNPASGPSNQGPPRPSFAAVAARNSTAPVGDATPKKPQPLSTAQRRFFATRKIPLAFPDSALLVGRLPLLVARCLTSLQCGAPLSFTATANKAGTISLTANEFSSAELYFPFFEKLTEFLNEELKLNKKPLETFQLAPSGVDCAIHTIPLNLLEDFGALDDEKILFKVMSEALSNARQISPRQVRLLTPDPTKRQGKTATSVVVTLSPQHAAILGDTVRLFSAGHGVSVLNTATATAHCKNCFALGHHHSVCKQKHATCPLCAKDHTHSAHRYLRKGEPCPKGGHERPITGCCELTPLSCINCKGQHAAFDKSCPKKLEAEQALLDKLKRKAADGVRRTHRRTHSTMETS